MLASAILLKPDPKKHAPDRTTHPVVDDNCGLSQEWDFVDRFAAMLGMAQESETTMKYNEQTYNLCPASRSPASISKAT
jgi:hypothetical protein